jgi:hypothetical protein
LLPGAEGGDDGVVPNNDSPAIPARRRKKEKKGLY